MTAGVFINRKRKQRYFGGVLDSGGTFTFDLPKIIGDQSQVIKGDCE